MGIAELLSVVALIVAAIGWLKVGSLRKDIASFNEEIASLRSHVTATSSILEQKIEDARRTMAQRSTGTPTRFHADMTVAEVLDLHPEAVSVMASFHLGGCSSCAIADHHVLGPACESYGVDTEALLTALNGLLDGGPVPAMQARGENLLQIDANS